MPNGNRLIRKNVAHTEHSEYRNEIFNFFSPQFNSLLHVGEYQDVI